MLTQNPDVNAEPFELKKGMQLCVENELMTEQVVTVNWQLRKADGSVIRSGSEEVKAEKLSATWLDYVDFADADTFADYISYEMLQDGKVISSGSALFCAPKHFKFVDPELKVRVEGDEIIITASAYARAVEILNADDTMLLSDNYFDMNPGEVRVRILKGEPTGLRVRSVYNIK